MPDYRTIKENGRRTRGTIQYNTIQFNSNNIQYNTIQFNSIQFNTNNIQNNTMDPIKITNTTK